MKKQSVVGLVFAVLVALAVANHGPCGQAEGDKGIDPKKLQITIDGKTLTINGMKLMVPCDRQDVLKVLGKPTREADLANKLLTWDELGVFAYQAPGTTKIRAIAIALDNGPHTFSPKKVFTGALKLDGVTVTAETNVEDLNQARKVNPPFKASFDTWVADYEDAGVWLTKPDKKTGSKTARIGTVEIDTKQKIEKK